MFGKTVEKKKKFTGFKGDTSREQDQCLFDFKTWIMLNEITDISFYDDYDLLRFCRARQFKLKDVTIMF